ncbi:uncharacterized protein TRIVIDRAFT_60559 [Trichoderma virens Gv29-8]|uniref:Uncharacterized protein n=1 Tax=Hypocrea virens (strain Gv29-8 / FGSC 10586) TaxID=413071 RepID=G9MR66_HYPVG|nr:uncharacterized protein TRIVIDRAFT_60559 [Trichoderma virens Gv29-8]EHK22592.1 hypothetical protein TRIVIDRAFT_60559 [Trichoderma virens Gv29-8]UKZ47638.1 hypothetical protein TrVGV298_001861 [Trichoderma virens]
MAPKRDATEAPSAALLRRSKRLRTDIGAVNEAEELPQTEEENDLEEAALSGVDGIKERNVEEETLVSEIDKEETQEDTKTIRREQIEIALKEMGLLPNIFGSRDKYFQTQPLIQSNGDKIKIGNLGESHCPKMDDIWQDYLGKLKDILGDNSTFDISTLAKPSGPFGAALHFQWHYLVNTKRLNGLKYRHVLDPSNPSLVRQIKKIGTPSNVSVSDTIPIRQPSRNPN